MNQKQLQNVQNRGRPSAYLSLMITTVISRDSCKTSREFFTFLKTLSNIHKIGSKMFYNYPSRVISLAKSLSQYIDCESNTKNSSIQCHKIKWGSHLKDKGANSQNGLHNTSKWLPVEEEML